MKLLPNRVDAQEDNEEDEETRFLVTIGDVMTMATRKEVRRARKSGQAVTGEDREARQMLAEEGVPQRQSAPIVKNRGLLRKKTGTRRSGRGFTKDEQLRGAVAGGKARWKGVDAKSRAAAARKAVMARWARTKKSK